MIILFYNMENAQEILNSYGWLEIESRNPYMKSFRKEETRRRLNFYYTTNTFTIDYEDGTCKVHRQVDTPEKLEEIISKI